VREAQLAARIRHPNSSVRMRRRTGDRALLHRDGVCRRRVAFVAFAARPRRGEGAAIITGIAHALALAEENQWWHRDISRQHHARSARHGQAGRSRPGQAAIDSRTSITWADRSWDAAYMSPEQARDAKVADTRTISTASRTFFECLTGRPRSREKRLQHHERAADEPSPSPPPSARYFPSRLICRKMMAKTRDLRYADPGPCCAICSTARPAGIRAGPVGSGEFRSRFTRRTPAALQYGVETSADGVASSRSCQ